MNLWKVLCAVVVGVSTVVGGIVGVLELADRWQRRSLPAPAPTLQPVPGDSADEPIPIEAEKAPQVEPPAAKAERETTRDIAGGDAAPQVVAPELGALINPHVVPAGSVSVMAIAFEGESHDIELLEARLVQRLSSPSVRLIPGLFKPAFRAAGFLRAAYDGDPGILARSGALAMVDRVLLGRVEHGCAKTTGQLDADLVTCNVRLLYKVIDRGGAVASAGQLAVAGAGFSEDAARDRAIEMLVEEHGERLLANE